MILSNIKFTSDNQKLALQQDDPLKNINNEAIDTICKIVDATKEYLLNKELPSKDFPEFNPFDKYKTDVCNILGKLEFEYRLNMSAGLRESKEMLRNVYSNPVIDSFKNIMCKDLSKYPEDFLNKEYTLYSKYRVKKNIYNYIQQMNPDVIYRQLCELHDTEELNNYIYNSLQTDEMIETCSLREASLLYSKILSYKDNMDIIYNIFDQMVNLLKEDLMKIIDGEPFTPKIILDFVSKRIAPVVQLITHIGFNVKSAIDTYVNIIEDFTIKIENDLFVTDMINIEEKHREYKAPIW